MGEQAQVPEQAQLPEQAQVLEQPDENVRRIKEEIAGIFRRVSAEPDEAKKVVLRKQIIRLYSEAKAAFNPSNKAFAAHAEMSRTTLDNYIQAARMGHYGDEIMLLVPKMSDRVAHYDDMRAARALVGLN